jgi:hypothetical protein
LELRPKAFRSFLAIISVVGLLGAMVNRNNLIDSHCVRLKAYLLEHLANGKLPRGTFRLAAVKFSVTRQTIFRLWKGWSVAHTNNLNGEWDVTTGKKASCRGLKYNCEQIAEGVCELPLRHRSTIRLLEGTLFISKSTIHDLQSQW